MNLSLTDAQMIEFLRRRKLAKRAARRVLSREMARTSSLFDQDDALQFALCGVAEGVATFKPETMSNMDGWCYRIAKRRVIDGMRSAIGRQGGARRIALGRRDHQDPAYMPHDGDEYQPVDNRDDVEEVLAALCPSNRAVAALYFLRGLKTLQIAEVLGITVKRVRAILSDITGRERRTHTLYLGEGGYCTARLKAAQSGVTRSEVVRRAAAGSIRVLKVTREDYDAVAGRELAGVDGLVCVGDRSGLPAEPLKQAG